VADAVRREPGSGGPGIAQLPVTGSSRPRSECGDASRPCPSRNAEAAANRQLKSKASAMKRQQKETPTMIAANHPAPAAMAASAIMNATHGRRSVSARRDHPELLLSFATPAAASSVLSVTAAISSAPVVPTTTSWVYVKFRHSLCRRNGPTPVLVSAAATTTKITSSAALEKKIRIAPAKSGQGEHSAVDAEWRFLSRTTSRLAIRSDPPLSNRASPPCFLRWRRKPK
jgi:hypothetical protein